MTPRDRLEAHPAVRYAKITLPKRFSFVILGFFLGLGAPVIWWTLTLWLGELSSIFLYGFLWLNLSLACCIFGYKLGRAQDHLREVSDSDALTGLLNQVSFFQTAGAVLSVAARYQRPMAILTFDVDNFKRINETHGHAVGSQTIQTLGRILKAQARHSDILARFGGDEFIVAMPETSLESARTAAERLRAAVAAQQHPGANGTTFFVTVSVGVAAATTPGQSEANLMHVLESADKALGRAKGAGRNRVAIP